MDLTARQGKSALRLLLVVPVVIFVLALTAPALPQSIQSTQGPCINQSPRKLKFDLARLDPPAQGEDYNFVSNTPLVAVNPANADKIIYQEHELQLCDRHYHVPVENLQGCPNETAAPKRIGSGPPPIGQWVEIHTVYASVVNTSGECATGHDHDLKCCEKPPFVVLGFSALIWRDDSPLLPTDKAEWAGSATKEDPTGCNALPAQWNFALGCQVRLTPETLEHIIPDGHAHPARALQGPDRVSTDLTFVGPETSYLNAECRKVRTEVIADNAAAQRICPGVCKWPLNRFTGEWNNVFPDGPNRPGYAVCGCCPLVRPQ